MARVARPQLVETVQLAFLAALSTKVQPRFFVLKGGANLRFFYGSHRSSEDMDFDVLDLAAWRLADKVAEALRSPLMAKLLAVRRISVLGAKATKQTETTQRWWVQATAPGLVSPIHVTGEFSRRITTPDEFIRARQLIVADPVSPALSARYGMPPIIVPHYLPAAAIHQKIGALADRAESQPRDVFDLDLLLVRHGDAAPRSGQVEADVAARAAARAAELDYAAFRDAVLPFIDAEVRSLYASVAAWSQIQDRIITYLLAVA